MELDELKRAIEAILFASGERIDIARLSAVLETDENEIEAAADALLENMGDGLYVTEVSGLHAGANAVSGDLSLLARGFEVAGGKPVRAVEQITVAGNFYRLLEDVTAAADDLVFDGSPVGCPTVMVKALSVAGE